MTAKPSPHTVERPWNQHRMRRGIIVLAGALLVVALAAIAGFSFAMHVYFQPDIPDADYPVPANRAEAWQQDFDYFSHYLRLNRPYNQQSREVARLLIEDLRANVDSLSDSVTIGYWRRNSRSTSGKRL